MPPRRRLSRTSSESRLTQSVWEVFVSRILEALAALEVPVQKALLARRQLGLISERYNLPCPTFLLGHRTASGIRVPAHACVARRLAFSPVEQLRLYLATRKRKREAETVTAAATERLRGLTSHRALVGKTSTSFGGLALFSSPPTLQWD